MQIRNPSLNHFRRGHCFIDRASSCFEDDGIEFHWFCGYGLSLLLRVRVSRFVFGFGIFFQILNAFTFQQRTRVIDIALYVALITFDAHLIGVNLRLDL